MDLFALSKIVGKLVLPPAGPLILGFVGLLLLGKAFRARLLCLVASLGALCVFSMPVVANKLQQSLQIYPGLEASEGLAKVAGAIVVLGGGRDVQASEYGGEDTVSPTSLVRLRYGAKLHRDTGLPVMVSGGSFGDPDVVPEADLMAKVLVREFNVPVNWKERDSRNTAENARYSADLLRKAGIGHVILVTHSSHMRRSVEGFINAGVDVTPARRELLGLGQKRLAGDLDAGIQAYIPVAWALEDSRAALHEYLGMVWYGLQYD